MDTFEDGSTASFDGQKFLETLKSLKTITNWELVDERRKFIHQVYPLIEQYFSQIPLRLNVQDVFSSEDVERLAIDCINFEHEIESKRFIAFLCNTGYKDEPKLDGDGKPSSRRTTPVHIAAKKSPLICFCLFDIYNRYDVNYTDETGLSHFHVACMHAYLDEAKKFLELGQDPNCLWLETGDSPLHLILSEARDDSLEDKETVELLLRSGADLNLANKEGLTPLHIISKKYTSGLREVPEVPKMLFEISDELNLPLLIDARDKFGNTPLHLALLNNNVYVTEMLLRRGANPHLANDEGSSPLHLFYMRRDYYDIGLMELFFKICDEVHLTNEDLYHICLAVAGKSS
ncbi:ankyrin-1-like [Trichogramma pretiosum]|uniref:ankyrin-1-like n=1 Tax=Trichogramma pretiosum TaxID=7493 RepID=UPI000C719F09|nr:ankyrin-1-like [Trichogramma pretiosum]